MKILLKLQRDDLKHEVIFETKPDDHVVIHEYNLAIVDLQLDKEYHQQSPHWKYAKHNYWKAKLFERFARHVPKGGWTLLDYHWLDYP